MTSSKFTGIKERESNLLIEEDGVCRRRKEYIEALCDDPNMQQPPLCFGVPLSGPDILKSEIAPAIKKTQKAEKVCYLHELMNTTYSRGGLTKDICQSIFIPLNKKAGTVLGEEFRTIDDYQEFRKMVRSEPFSWLCLLSWCLLLADSVHSGLFSSLYHQDPRSPINDSVRYLQP